MRTAISQLRGPGGGDQCQLRQDLRGATRHADRDPAYRLRRRTLSAPLRARPGFDPRSARADRGSRLHGHGDGGRDPPSRRSRRRRGGPDRSAGRRGDHGRRGGRTHRHDQLRGAVPHRAPRVPRIYHGGSFAAATPAPQARGGQKSPRTLLDNADRPKL
ncbi:MAG: hypothetical protein MZV64_70580 [Ignavibacteriales bacterium]|nr:hypothetical protein [Ignavibacteriales bacterium]